VRIRRLIQSFSDAQFQSFFSMLFTKYGHRRVLTSWIFAALHADLRRGVDEYIPDIYAMCQAVNEPASDTHGESRREDVTHAANHACTLSKNVAPPPPRSICTLPDVLISNVASFLRRGEQVFLMRTSRDLFIGCSTPSTFTRVSRMKRFVTNYGWPRLSRVRSFYSRFRLATTVELHADLFRGMRKHLSSVWKWSRLRSLCIGNMSMSDFALFKELPAHVRVHKLMCKMNVQITNVEALVVALCDVTSRLSVHCLEIGVRAISRFQNSVYINNDEIARSFQHALTGLGLCVHDSLSTFMINAVKNTIKSLHIDCRRTCAFPQIYACKQLEELCMCNVDRKTATMFLTSSSVLKRVCWSPQVPRLQTHDHEDHMRILRVVLNHSAREYVALIVPKWARYWLFHIELCIRKCTVSRERFKLRLRVPITDRAMLLYVVDKMRYIAEHLDRLTKGDFMLDVAMHISANVEFNVDWLRFQVHVRSPNIVIRTFMAKPTLLHITALNKENQMCGYQEPWLYSCCMCEGTI